MSGYLLILVIVSATAAHAFTTFQNVSGLLSYVNQIRANHLTIAHDQAAIGLMRKHQTGNAGDGERIGNASDDCEQHKHHDGGADLFQHGGLLRRAQWR